MFTNRAGKISNRAVKDVFNRILATVMVVALMLSVVPLNTVNAAESFSFMYSSAADNSVKSGDRVLVKRSSGSDDYEPFDYYDEDSKQDASEEIFEIGTDASLFDPMQTKSFGTISEEVSKGGFNKEVGTKSQNGPTLKGDLSKDQDNLMSLSTSKEKQVSDGVFVVKVSKNDIDRLRKDRDVEEVERDL